MNTTLDRTAEISRTDAVRRPAKAPRQSVTDTLEWQNAMVAYADAAIVWDKIEEDTPEAEAAAAVIDRAYAKVKKIIDRHYA